MEAFNTRYPELPPVPPFRTEEMLRRVGLEPDMPFEQWASAYGVDVANPNQDTDGDSWPLVAEFALGLDPREAERGQGPRGRVEPGRIEMEYELRLDESEHFMVHPQFSSDLADWVPIPPSQQASTDGHRRRVWVEDPLLDPAFLRLTFEIR